MRKFERNNTVDIQWFDVLREWELSYIFELAAILVMISKSDIKNLSVERLFIFGSSLYGEGKDLDLLVISDDFSGMSEKARILRLKNNFVLNQIDPQCYTVKEFERLIGESTFFKHILQEATEIYD